MALEHFLNGPNRTKFENLANTEISWNCLKIAIFSLQNIKTRPFSTISTGILGTHTPGRVFFIRILFFENAKIFLDF